MAVAPASLADKIIVLDGDDDGEEESLSASCSVSTSIQPQAEVFQPKVQQPVASPITQWPCVSARREPHVLQAENERLFGEFVDHCLADTTDCPEVLDYLKTRHAKASPEYLCSVEFRNTLGHCLSRAQAHRSKTFVYINELCTVLTQHAAKKRQVTTQVEPDSSSAASVAFRPTSPLLESGDAIRGFQANACDRSSQIAYLENLLKMYNDEIHRLQKSELSLEDLDAEDSLFIQESKLKRKVRLEDVSLQKLMKIYEKLCELKGCSTLTGRVIEHRITYSSTRYPEINRRRMDSTWIPVAYLLREDGFFQIERFINGPEAQQTPPDYQDILQQMLRANERHNLCLSRKQLNQMAKEAFREVGTRIQDRRHLDLVYNFGSHLTDPYKPATDPALLDASLLRKLRSNREVAVSRLEEVISKYANKQEDTEELERRKRQEKKGRGVRARPSVSFCSQEFWEVTGTASPHTFPFQDSKSEKEGKKEANEEEEQQEEQQQQQQQQQEQEEEEDDEDDEEEEEDSSDPDIEEEMQASAQQEGPGDPGTQPVQPESPQTEPQEPGQESDREAVASEEPLESHTPGPGVATRGGAPRGDGRDLQQPSAAAGVQPGAPADSAPQEEQGEEERKRVRGHAPDPATFIRSLTLFAAVLLPDCLPACFRSTWPPSVTRRRSSSSRTPSEAPPPASPGFPPRIRVVKRTDVFPVKDWSSSQREGRKGVRTRLDRIPGSPGMTSDL
ncbi:unnamed protein product [Tetraodon nigroviridis]|uniref:Death domain-associated protein 6 n=1 Tax=Tetraodon nigroviridis TaxID=99883 RepID=Q4RIU8_TETNG|nr:unnamed protein product [Tetraodon nigroviridis]